MYILNIDKGTFWIRQDDDEYKLRVRALFSVINEHSKLNAKDNVIKADFSRAYALAA